MVKLHKLPHLPTYTYKQAKFYMHEDILRQAYYQVYRGEIAYEQEKIDQVLSDYLDVRNAGSNSGKIIKIDDDLFKDATSTNDLDSYAVAFFDPKSVVYLYRITDNIWKVGKGTEGEQLVSRINNVVKSLHDMSGVQVCPEICYYVNTRSHAYDVEYSIRKMAVKAPLTEIYDKLGSKLHPHSFDGSTEVVMANDDKIGEMIEAMSTQGDVKRLTVAVEDENGRLFFKNEDIKQQCKGDFPLTLENSLSVPLLLKRYQELLVMEFMVQSLTSELKNFVEYECTSISFDGCEQDYHVKLEQLEDAITHAGHLLYGRWTVSKYQEKLNYFLFEIYRHLRGTLKGLRHRSGMNISMVPVVEINYSTARDYACPSNAIAKNYCLQFSKDNRKTLTELPTEIIHKYRAYLTGSKLVKKSEIQTMIDVWKYLLVRYDCLV